MSRENIEKAEAFVAAYNRRDLVRSWRSSGLRNGEHTAW
jgi:hypothetical protein